MLRFRRKEASSYSNRYGRGASSRSYKSDNTLLTPLLDDDSISDIGSDDSDDTSTAASYEGATQEKHTVSELVKLAVGE